MNKFKNINTNFKKYIISRVQDYIDNNNYQEIKNIFLSHTDILSLYIADEWEIFAEDNNINLNYELLESTENEIICEIIPIIIPGILSIIRDYSSTENLPYTRNDGKIIIHKFQTNNILFGIRENNKVIAKIKN